MAQQVSVPSRSTRTHAPRDPPPAPPKSRPQTNVHWSDRVQECIVSSADDGSFNGLSFAGGADSGKFCYVNQIEDLESDKDAGKFNEQFKIILYDILNYFYTI